MAFTEFYCDFTNGNNTYAGSTTGAPVTTLTGGDWVSATGVFTLAGADLSGVSVGMFAAVMVDAGTVAAIIGRITAVDDGADTVTVSTTAKSGSLADQTATATLTVGGVWKGPNAAVDFPFGFITNALTNASGDAPRVNFKNNATYAVTQEIGHSNNGPMVFQGYATTPGDLGKATIDGGAIGDFWLLFQGGTGQAYVDLVFSNNGGGGGSHGVVLTGNQMVVSRCVFSSMSGSGVYVGGTSITLSECEAYGNNKSNNAGSAGIYVANGSNHIKRCISHDNAGSNSDGFGITQPVVLEDCIADTNGRVGFLCDAGTAINLVNCDAYNNASDGIRLTNTSTVAIYIENCNLIKNGGYGINGSGAGARLGAITNCGFGSGTEANTSGTTTGLKSIVESGSITYAANVTPWVDPANGDFRIHLSTAKGTGRGTFTQTAASYAGTIGYPDVGAAQHLETSGIVGKSIIIQNIGTY